MPDWLETGDGDGPFYSRAEAEAAAEQFKSAGLQTRIEESWIGLGTYAEQVGRSR